MPPELSATQRDVIIRLRLDPTAQREGYAQAKQIQRQAQDEMLALKAQEIRTRGELESRFTAEYLRQMRAQLSEASKISADKRAALQLEMKDYQVLTEKIRGVRAEYAQQQVLAKEAQLAARGFQSTSGANNPWATWGNQRVLSGFTPSAMLTTVGLGALGTVGIPMLAKQIGEALSEAAVAGGEYAHSLELISQKTGIAVPQLQQFEAVGKATGLSLDDMVIATKKFSAAVLGAGVDESGNAVTNAKGQQILEAFKISVRDAAGNIRPMNDLLGDLADKFVLMPDGMEKSRIAVELFGKSGLRLVPILDKGKDGFREIVDAVKPYQANLQGIAEEYERYEIAGAKSEAASNKLKVSLVDMLPAVVRLKEAFADLKNAIAEALGSPGTLKTGEELTFKGRQAYKQAALGAELTAPRDFFNRPDQNAISAGADASVLAQHAQDMLQAQDLLQQYRKATADGNEKLQASLVGQAEKLQASLLIHVDIVGEMRQENDEAKKAAAIAGGLKDAKEAEIRARQKNIEKLLEELDALRKTSAQKNAALANFGGESEGQLQLQQNTGKYGELFALSMRQRTLTPGSKELLENLERQKTLRTEIAALEDKDRSGLYAQARAEREHQITEELQKQLEALDKIFNTTPSNQGILTVPQRTLALGTQPVGLFQQSQKEINDRENAGLYTLKEHRDAVQALVNAMQTEVWARRAIINPTQEQIEQLGVLNQALKTAEGTLVELRDKNPFEGFVSSMKQITDIIGQFSGGLGKGPSEFSAGFKLLSGGLNSIRDLSKGKDSLAGGFQTMFSNITDSGGGVMGTLGGIASAAGPIGAAISGVMSMVMPLFNIKRKQNMDLVEQVKEQFKGITQAFQEGTKSLHQTIDDLTSLRAKAVANTKGGKKGNSSEMQKEIDQIDSQLASLKKQQKDVMDNFHSQLGLFSVPAGAKDVATSIQAIVQELKKAADAGASATEQIKFLNAAMDELKNKTAKGLRTDENDTLNMLKESLQLEQQRSKVISDEADAELQIRRSLGLARELTPEQQAALQLKKLRDARDEQLQQIDEQRNKLKADLDGRMQLFGWTQKDLAATDARAKILAEQLTIEKLITAETITRISATQAMLKDMQAGNIPVLPAGVLPGYAFPGGADYKLQGVTINISVGGTNATPQQIADAVRNGIYGINRSRMYGMQ